MMPWVEGQPIRGCVPDSIDVLLDPCIDLKCIAQRNTMRLTLQNKVCNDDGNELNPTVGLT